MCFISESCRLDTYIFSDHTLKSHFQISLKGKMWQQVYLLNILEFYTWCGWWYLHNLDSVQRPNLIHILYRASSSEPCSNIHLEHLARKPDWECDTRLLSPHTHTKQTCTCIQVFIASTPNHVPGTVTCNGTRNSYLQNNHGAARTSHEQLNRQSWERVVEARRAYLRLTEQQGIMGVTEGATTHTDWMGAGVRRLPGGGAI